MKDLLEQRKKEFEEFAKKEVVSFCRTLDGKEVEPTKTLYNGIWANAYQNILSFHNQTVLMVLEELRGEYTKLKKEYPPMGNPTEQREFWAEFGGKVHHVLTSSIEELKKQI